MIASRIVTAVSGVVASTIFTTEHVNADGSFSFNPFRSSPRPPSPEVIPPDGDDTESGDFQEKEDTEKRVRNNNPRTTAAGFDPRALEKGAKALREINNSSNVKKVGRGSTVVGLERSDFF